jgi:signal transduction histidine kinase
MQLGVTFRMVVSPEGDRRGSGSNLAGAAYMGASPPLHAAWEGASNLMDDVGAQLPVRQLRIGAVVLGVLAAAVTVLSRLSGFGIDGVQLSVIAASLAIALTWALAWLNFVVYRIANDPRSLYIAVAAVGLAVFPLTFGTVVPVFIDAPALVGMRAIFALAAIPALAGVALASRSLETAAAHQPRRVVVAVAAGTLGVVAVGVFLPWTRTLAPEAGVPLPLAGTVTSGAIAAGFAAIALVHLVAARRQSGQPLSWSALAAGGVGAAYALTVTGGEAAQPFAWLLVAAAVAVGLYGAAAELQRHHAAERQRAFDAVVDAFEATARAQAVHDEQAERRHEAKGALLGIEAAAQGLARHRTLLTPEEFDELSASLVAEVYRLRMLIESPAGWAGRERTFDLREVVVPVVSVLRADGLDVRSSIPPGVAVHGIPEHTAQVLVSLLTNAKRHAPGSPVDLRVEVNDDHVTVFVDDRGPGVPVSERERVFQRGAQIRAGEGSGLGLFIARRLIESQHGSLRVEDRTGGGCSFVLSFPTGGTASGSSGEAA